jgi:N-acetylmuramoyl-L-alanine amidase
MWIQRASYTSQLDSKSMLHLRRNMHGISTFGRWWISPVLLFIVLGVAKAADLEEPHHVTAVRFWSLGSVTRIAIETDGDFQVKSDRLDNPDRLFFDLTGTRPELGRKGMTTIPVSDHFVRQIRVAEPQRGVTRVVLDLETTVESTTSRLDNPTRLIIELRASGSAPETTKAPVRAPPTLIEPVPAPKPADRRPFTPPAARPVAIPVVQVQQASLELPPVLQMKSTPPPVPVALAMHYKPGPPPARTAPAGVLAKSASPEMANNLANNLLPTTSVSNTPLSNASLSGASISTASLSSTTLSATPPSNTPAVETALPAKRDSSGDRSMIRVLGLKVGRIVLDPGHGGHDTGSVGPAGLREKDLVLDVAQRLGHLIEERMGSEVIFTRSDDTFIPLERRTEIANEAKADLFLSIHANSSPLRNAVGVETYYLNFTTSRTALDLASRENSGSQMTVYELQGLLQKIALKDKAEESREFASRVQTALFNLSAKTDARSKDRGVKKAPFVVLIGASMPSVLAEIGFVSNAHDESVMRREEYRQRTAEALYKGISSYANTLSHFQVAQRH